MTILTFKDISMDHLAHWDIKLLEGGGQPMDAMHYATGWIVSTASLVTVDFRDHHLRRLRQAGFSESFVAAALAAGIAGCWLLRFDLDADVDPDLPLGEDDAVEHGRNGNGASRETNPYAS